MILLLESSVFSLQCYKTQMKRIGIIEKDWALPFCFLMLDTCLLCVAAIKHAFWRDETQAWLISRDSPTFMSLMHNTRYEGHPPLWHVLLFPLTRLSWNPRWMELPNLFFAISAAALLLFAKRLTLPTRVGLTFSYFLLFEYGTITRNYMAGVALLLGATILMTRKDARPDWTVPLVLSLAALSSLPALILSVVLFCVYLAQNFLQPDASTKVRFRSPNAPILLSSVLFAVCALVSVLLIKPPFDTGVYLAYPPIPGGLPEKLSRCSILIAGAFLPIPVWTSEFWEKLYVLTLPLHVRAVLGWVLFAAIAFYFKRPIARYFFLAGSALLLTQELLSRRFGLRSMGWLFVCFILALLLEHTPLGQPSPDQQAGSRWRSCLLAIILISQTYSGLFALGISLHYPFSRSQQAADFLRNQHLDSAPLVFEPDYVSSTILAYLQRRDAYSVELRQPVSFTIWNRAELLERHIPTPAEMKIADNGSLPVLITEKPLSPSQESTLQVHLIASFDGAIASFDNYYIYR
jgi:hypothetical protein